jgi:hypothetical protein
MTKPKLPATPSQIAAINSLLLRTTELAKKINYPINGFFLGLLQALLDVITTARVRSSINTVGGALIAGPIFIYAYCLFWQQVTNMSYKLFPNGMGVGREIDRQMLVAKPFSREEAAAIIGQLQKLAAKQETAINRVFYGSIGISYVMPCVLMGKMGFPDICLSAPGPALVPYMRNRQQLQGVRWLIGVVAKSVQGIPIVKKLFDYYSNYNTPKQISNCLNFLNAVTAPYNSDKWEIAVKGDKKSVIFSLTLPPDKNFTLPNNGGIITGEDLLIELHRVMAGERLPIFVSLENVIYIGYCDFNKKTIQRMQRKLDASLTEVVDYEQRSEKVIMQLNTVNSVLPKQSTKLVWDSYRVLDAYGNRCVFYYCDTSSLAPVYRHAFVASLHQCVDQKHLSIDENVVTLKQMQTADNIALTLKQAFQATIDKLAEEQRLEHQSALQSRKAPERVSSASILKALSSVESKKDAKDKDEGEDEKGKLVVTKSYSKPISFSKKGKMYPMDVPWVPAGRCFASVAPELVEAVQGYVAPEQIQAELKKGAVSYRSYKSKGVAAGIFATTELYTSIDGRTEESAFKMKHGNIRLFAHKEERVKVDGCDFIHYEFNGWRFGH